MDNILHSSLSIFHSFLLWVCGLGIAAIALAYVGYLLARCPGKVRRSVRTYGLPTVIALAALMVFAAIEGTPTNEDKERYRQQHQQQQGGLPDPGQNGSVPGDPGESDSDADGLPGIMTLELGDDDYGTDGSDGATEGADTIEAESLTLPDIRPLTESDYAAGIVLSQIGTDETHSFEPILGAEICDDWRRFGAATDWFRCKWRMKNEEWRMVLGTNVFDAVTVLSYGTVRPSMTNLMTFISPFRADIGIVPEANWSLLSPITRYQSPTTNDDDILHSPFSILHSQFWQALTPSNTFVMCWQNVPWNRDVHYPFSFMIEFEEKGDITFRYDLTNVKWRMENGEWVENSVLSNDCVGVMNNGLGRTFNALPTNVTSLKFAHLDPTRADDSDSDGDGLTTEDEVLVHHTDPYDADTDKDGLSDGCEVNETHTDPLDPHSLDPRYPDGVAVVLGDLDPFDSPEGSAHTYFEHVFYTGTTNAPFASPQDTDDTAVLVVTVRGSGAGELIVGDTIIPLLPKPEIMLLAEGHDAPAPQEPTTLRVPLAKGVKYGFWGRVPETLQVEIDSGSYTIASLPQWYTLNHGWIAFPNTAASIPCIHDLGSGDVVVTLDPGQDIAGMSCEWTPTDRIKVEQLSPLSARLTGSFPRNSMTPITYTLSHPDYYRGPESYTQMARFCPNHSDSENEGDIQGSTGSRVDSEYGDAESDSACTCSADNPCGNKWCSCGCSCGREVNDDEETPPSVCREHNCPYEDCEELHHMAYTNAMSLASVTHVLRLGKSPLDFDQISLTVPTNMVQCCPCPDHWTNKVSLASKAHNLAVRDLDGDKFVSTNADCAVRVYGLAPSRDFKDSTLSFCRTGTVFGVRRYTVLGVGIHHASYDLQKINQAQSSFGCPVVIGRDVGDASDFVFRTDVDLPGGNVSLGTSSTNCAIKIWHWNWREERYDLLLDATETTNRVFSIEHWRQMIRDDSGGHALVVRVTAEARGSVDLTLSYAVDHDGETYSDDASQRLTAILPPLIADYNHNGRIDESDYVCYGEGLPFRFWTNEDTTKGDYFVDPGLLEIQSRNASDLKVNGLYDLLNFFPVAIDLRELNQAWGTNGDEVLEILTNNNIHVLSGASSSLGHLSWHKQELFKGRLIGNGLGGTTWAGWNIDENIIGGNKISVETAREMDRTDPSAFKTNTVFYLNPPSMNQSTIPLLVRGAHLTMGIPALTPSVGWTGLNGKLDVDVVFDEDDTSQESKLPRPNGWPVRSSYPNQWLHSDMKDMSYFYNFKFYERVKEKGGL